MWRPWTALSRYFCQSSAYNWNWSIIYYNMASKGSTMKQKNDNVDSDAASAFNKNEPKAPRRGKTQKASEMETRNKKKDITMKDPIDMIFK